MQVCDVWWEEEAGHSEGQRGSATETQRPGAAWRIHHQRHCSLQGDRPAPETGTPGLVRPVRPTHTQAHQHTVYSSTWAQHIRMNRRHVSVLFRNPRQKKFNEIFAQMHMFYLNINQRMSHHQMCHFQLFRPIKGKSKMLFWFTAQTVGWDIRRI